MFEGFRLATIDTGEATIRLRHGGRGPPLLLLHGNPQTHVMWHKVAPRLAERFTVVAADLRGYGDSSKPADAPDHAPHSKRAMARDQIAVMRQLGFERFFVAGHDRGGRCAYRMVPDHPDVVQKLAVLDIIPTYEHYRRTDMRFAIAYWHWFFLAQPYPLPEQMIGADPDWYCLRGRRHLFDPEAWKNISAASAIPTPATPSARTTAPAPPSTTRWTRRPRRRPPHRLPAAGPMGRAQPDS
jgi:haloacetate dehalogenase